MSEQDIWWQTPMILALLVGLICPTTGSLLITQRRILLANLLAHSVLPGLVVALAFELDPTIGGLISGILGALVAERINQRYPGREDGAMNTVLAGFMAIGVLLVPLLQARVDLVGVLFGDLLAASEADLIRTGITAIVLIALLVWRYQDLIYIGVDPEGATADNLPVAQIRFLMIVVTAMVIISSITAVGVVLVIALLCAPALIHLDQSKSLRHLILRSAGTGLVLCGGGMVLALIADLPPGPLIGVLSMAILILRRL